MNTSKLIHTYHDPHRRWTIHQGDVQHVLPTLSSSLYDASVTDAPYGIGFMEHGWDSEVPPVTVWKQLYKTCKPGAYLLTFGGTKTFHRLFCSTEDAGWEIRDTMCWLYGSGFPKGHNISKAIDEKLRVPVTAPASDVETKWDGYNTALKPAWEPILLAQKPRRGTFAKNALRFGCGGLNVSGCRIGTTGDTSRSHQEPHPHHQDGGENRKDWARTGHSVESLNKGRWPANVMLDEDAAQELDRQSGRSRSSRGLRRKTGSDVGNGKTLKAFRSRLDAVEGYDDEGGASRFFFVAKASRKERVGNDHPTVKPKVLCEHLAQLILPPQRKTPRRLIVPFSGSGSEMLGALMAGWDHVTGIELDPHFVKIARKRLADFSKESAMPA